MRTTLFIVLLFLACIGKAQIITTVAGGGNTGLGDGGAATDCQLLQPIGVAVDGAGNIYIGDRDNNRIRKVNASTGIITTIVGTGVAGYSGDGGLATDAKINKPYGIAVDVAGNVFFVDAYNYRIRKIGTSGIITTVAGTGIAGYNGDGIATATKLGGGSGIAIDNYSNIYITDAGNNTVRKINSSGILMTIAGNGSAGYSGDNGPATAAKFDVPYAISLDIHNNIYVADEHNHCIRKVTADGIISTIAGNGISGYNGDNLTATAIQLNKPAGVCVDKFGNVYIADTYNFRVRRVSAVTGIVETIAGNGLTTYNGDGIPATDASISTPTGIFLDANSNIYISDFAHSRIRYLHNTVSVPAVSMADRNAIIFPNPCNGSFTMHVESDIIMPIEIMITDIAGRNVYQSMSVTNTNILVNVDVPTGLYLINAAGYNFKWSGKLSILK